MESNSRMDAKPPKHMHGDGMHKPHEAALTDVQKAKILDILSKYDGDSLSEKDAQAIFEEMRKADIHPGPGFKETIEEAGFDMEQFKPKGSPPPPPPRK